MIGHLISHYKILEKLGGGGMGIVYKAEDTKLERLTALKFLPPGLTGDREATKRFLVEARAAAALNHANIVTIYEIGEYDNRLYIAMEYIRGENLKQKIASRPLNIYEITRIGRKIAKGLLEAHEKGIIHRDIKSSNIMISKKREVKIMDFGLAMPKGQVKIAEIGAVLGTVTYMSPEQAQGEDVDHRSDIWSLGVVLYEMVTGKMPFQGDSTLSVIHAILNEKPQPLIGLGSGIPIDLVSIINKALAKKPTDRYESAAVLRADLKKIKKFQGRTL
jgi:serine/threonine protein kinase